MMGMAKLTEKETLHIAHLAKLELTETEIEKFSGQISKVVDFISQLKEVDVKGLKPTNQTTGLTNVVRKDEVNPVNILSQDAALSGTEETHNGFFKVGAILTERSDK